MLRLADSRRPGAELPQPLSARGKLLGASMERYGFVLRRTSPP